VCWCEIFCYGLPSVGRCCVVLVLLLPLASCYFVQLPVSSFIRILLAIAVLKRSTCSGLKPKSSSLTGVVNNLLSSHDRAHTHMHTCTHAYNLARSHSPSLSLAHPLLLPLSLSHVSRLSLSLSLSLFFRSFSLFLFLSLCVRFPLVFSLALALFSFACSLSRSRSRSLSLPPSLFSFPLSSVNKAVQ